MVYSLLHMLSNINLLVDSFYSIIYLSPCHHVVTYPLVSLVKEAVLYVSSLHYFGSMKSDHFLGIQDPLKVFVQTADQVLSLIWDVSQTCDFSSINEKHVRELILMHVDFIVLRDYKVSNGIVQSVLQTY